MSPIISKACLGFLAAMNLATAVLHLKDPYSSLTDVFEVKGPISPIAAHCCAIIGASSFPVVAMLIYAIFAPASVRRILALCYCTTLPPAGIVQIWYPFNDPAPKFPTDMPYPLFMIMIVCGLCAAIFAGIDEKPKKK